MHRSLSIEADLSSPTTCFSLASLGFQSGKRFRDERFRPRSRHRPRPREAWHVAQAFVANAWRGAAFARSMRPRDICFSAQSDQKMSQLAAPGNNPG